MRIAGRLPEAIAEYQTALRIRPDRTEIHYNLANALARLPGLETLGRYSSRVRRDIERTLRQLYLLEKVARPGGPWVEPEGD